MCLGCDSEGYDGCCSGTGCSDFCPVSSLHFTRASLGKRDHKPHVYPACWTSLKDGSQENLGSLLKTRRNCLSASSLGTRIAVSFTLPSHHPSPGLESFRVWFLLHLWSTLRQLPHTRCGQPPCTLSLFEDGTGVEFWDSWWVGNAGSGTSSLWSPVKLRASLCFHATVGILKGSVSTPCPPSIKLFSGIARATVVLCFLPLPSLLLREQVRIGVVVGGSSGARLLSSAEEEPTSGIIQKVCRPHCWRCTSGSHMESPLAEVGGILA